MEITDKLFNHKQPRCQANLLLHQISLHSEISWCNYHNILVRQLNRSLNQQLFLLRITNHRAKINIFSNLHSKHSTNIIKEYMVRAKRIDTNNQLRLEWWEVNTKCNQGVDMEEHKDKYMAWWELLQEWEWQVKWEETL